VADDQAGLVPVAPGTACGDDFSESAAGSGGGGGGPGGGRPGGPGGGRPGGPGAAAASAEATAAAATADVRACVAAVLGFGVRAPPLADDASRGLASALVATGSVERSPAGAGSTAAAALLVHPAKGHGDYLAPRAAVWAGLSALADADGVAAVGVDLGWCGRLLAESVTGGAGFGVPGGCGWGGGGGGGGKRRWALPPTAGAERARRRLFAAIRTWAVAGLDGGGRHRRGARPPPPTGAALGTVGDLLAFLEWNRA